MDTPIAPSNSTEKRTAYLSLVLLLLVVVFHGVWLFFRNVDMSQGDVSYYISQHGVFLFIIIALLNFFPYFVGRRLYYKGLYRKQVIISTILFIVFQFVLHFILTTMGAVVC